MEFFGKPQDYFNKVKTADGIRSGEKSQPLAARCR
jgi:hypothetical protein